MTFVYPIRRRSTKDTNAKIVSAGNNLRDQLRKPTGWVGRFVLWEMNRHHSKLTDWGLSHVAIKKIDTILDIGCGGGRTISKLAAIASDGRVHGIDYSEESVAAAKRQNARWIDIGRVEINQASVSQLPFADNTFDLVTAIETHFFWPNLHADVEEVLRVIKSGGAFIIIAEVYKGGKKMAGKLAEKYIELTNMTLLTVDEHYELFKNAGFSDVRIFEEQDKGWICGIGRKH